MKWQTFQINLFNGILFNTLQHEDGISGQSPCLKSVLQKITLFCHPQKIRKQKLIHKVPGSQEKNRSKSQIRYWWPPFSMKWKFMTCFWLLRKARLFRIQIMNDISYLIWLIILVSDTLEHVGLGIKMKMYSLFLWHKLFHFCYLVFTYQKLSNFLHFAPEKWWSFFIFLKSIIDNTTNIFCFSPFCFCQW